MQLPGLTRKSADKKPYPPGQHGQSKTGRRKTSEFRRLLEEKQKVRFNYGVSEGQLRRYLGLARKMAGRTGDNLLGVLASRPVWAAKRSIAFATPGSSESPKR